MRLSILSMIIIVVWAQTTERFEAIYPLLKEVALAPGSREIFGFSLKLAGEGIITK